MQLVVLDLERQRRSKERQVYAGKLKDIDDRLEQIRHLICQCQHRLGLIPSPSREASDLSPIQAEPERPAVAPRKKTMDNMGLYVYGFIFPPANDAFGNIGLTCEGQPGAVYALRAGSLAAVVSRYPVGEKIMPLRKNLEPHNQVIRTVMQSTTIVPMRFGHVARGEEEIFATLDHNREALWAALTRLQGMVEMRLRMTLGVSNVFAYFAANDAEIAQRRDTIFGGRTPNTSEKMELGRLFEERLSATRERESQRVLAVIGPLASEIKTNAPKGENTLLDVSLLVGKDGLRALEDCLHEVAETLPAEYVFNYTGPWAPSSFADFEIEAAQAA